MSKYAQEQKTPKTTQTTQTTQEEQTTTLLRIPNPWITKDSLRNVAGSYLPIEIVSSGN
jgi:hypothetical protein